MSEKGRLAVASGVIAAACVAAFYPAFRAGITNWDDPAYLAASLHPGAAFQRFVIGNYQPLTVLSLALGRTAFALHAVNVALHVVAAVLLVVFLWQLTGSVAGAAAGGLLWAVHPLRVESVVWIAARKDVLSGVFFIAALVAYVAHARGRRGALAASFVLFVLAALAKPTAIAFPLVMLAIDWLLERRAWKEKAMFFAAAGLFAAVAVAAQRSAVLGDVPALAFTIPQRIVLSCRVIVLYLARVVAPVNLSAFYPYPARPGAAEWSAVAIVIAVVAVAAATLRWSRASVFALVFFLITVALTLPMFAIGWTLAADRFTYLPSIGFAYLIALTVRSVPRTALAAAAVAIVFIVATNIRSRVWHDSISLWTSVIDNSDVSRLPFNSRAVALADLGRYAEARRDLDRAIEIDPCYGQALRNRAVLSVQEGRLGLAAADLARFTACSPSSADAWNMRGTVLRHIGREAEARQCFAREAALRQRR